MGVSQAPIRTANDLAAQFAARVNEHGWCWLSVKQTAWLKSLASRDMGRAGGREFSDTHVYTEHGWPKVSGYLGNREWLVLIHHNGAGRFSIEGELQ